MKKVKKILILNVSFLIDNLLDSMQPFMNVEKRPRTISEDEITSVNDLMGIDIISFDEEDYFDKIDSSMMDIDPSCFENSDKALNKSFNSTDAANNNNSNYKSYMSNYGQPIKKSKVKSVSPHEKPVMFSPTTIKPANFYKKKDFQTIF